MELSKFIDDKEDSYKKIGEIIKNHTDSNGIPVAIAKSDIAKQARLSEDTVKRQILKLEENNQIFSEYKRLKNQRGGKPALHAVWRDETEIQLTIPGIHFKQGNEDLYLAIIDGKKLEQISTVFRRKEHETGREGYQRAISESRVEDLSNFLNDPKNIIPPALTVAVDEIIFKPLDKRHNTDSTNTVVELGSLTVPYKTSVPKNERSIWIVDGQHRLEGIKRSNRKEFPIGIILFQGDIGKQALQFTIINSTAKGIEQSLINELIPQASTIDSVLPNIMEKRIKPTTIGGEVREELPFKGVYKGYKGKPGISIVAIDRMIEHSLKEGILRRIEIIKGYHEIKNLLLKGQDALNVYKKVINLFWVEVFNVFPHAIWKNGDPSTEKLNMKSKLVQLVGIRAMGRFMDYELGRLLDRYTLDKLVNHDSEIKEEIRRDLTIISKDCYFERVHEIPEGSPLIWWKTLSNKESDIRRLSDFMKEKIWSSNN